MKVNSLISHFSTKCEIVPMSFLFKIRSVCFTEGDFTGSCDWSLFPRKIKSLHLAKGRSHSMRCSQAASLNLSVTMPWRCTVIDLMSARYWIFVSDDCMSVCAWVSGGWVVWSTTLLSVLIFRLVWDRVILLPAAVHTVLGNRQAPKKFPCFPQTNPEECWDYRCMHDYVVSGDLSSGPHTCRTLYPLNHGTSLLKVILSHH